MDLQGHLLYIDITQICGIGCAFCMYADKHKAGISMELSTLARENLARLINAPEVKRISVSGEGECFGIDYKNLVHPAPGIAPGYLDMQGYIEAIESKVNKRFTFGSLNKPPQANGLDVTVKPSGDLYLYGIENQRLGNIHFDRVDWQRLVAHVRETPLTRALYTHPLTELLARLESTDLLRSIIAKANNPYWLVKELAGHAGLLEQWEVA
ncbi:TPA: hypothetical protein L5V82_006534 [Pseudomonas aeruginosa]|nr:hypothetical protein [Pseudomonas aeruginosa]